jgi:hypothetical protein
MKGMVYHIRLTLDGRRNYAETDIPDADFVAGAVKDMLPEAVSVGLKRIEGESYWEVGLSKADEELRVTEELLAERNRLLDAIPECSVHGPQCVPHAIEWIKDEAARRRVASGDAYNKSAEFIKDWQEVSDMPFRLPLAAFKAKYKIVWQDQLPLCFAAWLEGMKGGK